MFGRSVLSVVLLVVSVSAEACYDDTTWLAADFETCGDYANQAYCTPAGGVGSGWDPAWGSLAEFADQNGRSALDACCACGGGVQRDCRDSVDEWKDGAGDGCSDYGAGYYCTVDGQEGMGWNTTWGALDDYANRNGVTAKQACCVCGGGLVTWPPTPASSAIQFIAPGATPLPGATLPPSSSTSTSTSSSSSTSSTSSTSTTTVLTSTSSSTSTSTAEPEDTPSSSGAEDDGADDGLMYGMFFGGIAIVLLGVGVGAALYMKAQKKKENAAKLQSLPTDTSESGSIWRHF